MSGRKSTAHVQWEGPLNGGSGTLNVESGELHDASVTWASRAERARGTNPEELIAAAHATCYAMSLSNLLADAGEPVRHLDVSATCLLVRRPEGGVSIQEIDIGVVGRVPEMTEQDFERLAEQARDESPVSRALAGNVDVHVRAHLQGGVTVR